MPGNVKLEIHRPLSRYYHRTFELTPDNTEGPPEVTPPTFSEIKQVQQQEQMRSSAFCFPHDYLIFESHLYLIDVFQADNKGCASFIVKMTTFTKLEQKILRDQLQLKASVEEEGTGKSSSMFS